jgi:hypothetical protein
MKRTLSLVVVLAICASSGEAGAQTICGTGADGPVVYVAGSSAAKPFLAALARVLYHDAANPITLVYKSIGSCVGVASIVNGDTMISGMASYWDPTSTNTGNEVMCTIGTGTIAGALLPDVAASDVFAESCISLSNGLPAQLKDFFGPVQTMTFVVPKASSQKSISASAAYFVFGFGNDSGVAPWTNDSYIFRRNSGSGTQTMIGTAIGVPIGKFKGQDSGSSSGVITKVTSSGASENTIGILANTDISDTVSLSVNVLAYKHYGQSCGHYPDSAPGSKDKQNVRDGHYAIWGPIHFLAHVDQNGFIANPNARRVVNYVTGTAAPPGGVDLIQVAALSNLVPSCAMRVKRSTEMGPFSTLMPDASCGCYFDYVATGHSTCAQCTKDADCGSGTPKCNHGYCEVQ